MPRPLVESPNPATLRKRRQMARRRAEGRKVLLLTPTRETLDKLGELTRLTGGSAKSEAEMILRRGVGTALDEAKLLAAKMGPIYREAKIYQPYARFLTAPGATLRVRDRELKAADWRPLAAELGQFYDFVMRRWGWTRKRADRFLRRAAEPPGSSMPAE
jgi:hypothetical protein